MKNKHWRDLIRIHGEIICPYCLRPIENSSQLTIEHEPPKSRQAELGIKSKKIYACKKCNHEKGSLTAKEYEEWKRLEKIRNGGLNDRTRHR